MPPSPSAQSAVQKLFASCIHPWDARGCQSSEETWADPPEGSIAHLPRAVSEHSFWVTGLSHQSSCPPGCVSGIKMLRRNMDV